MKKETKILDKKIKKTGYNLTEIEKLLFDEIKVLKKRVSALEKEISELKMEKFEGYV